MIRLGPIDVEETSLAKLCRRYHVQELAVFGSAARGDMRPESDIDFLVGFLPEAGYHGSSRHIADFIAGLDFPRFERSELVRSAVVQTCADFAGSQYGCSLHLASQH